MANVEPHMYVGGSTRSAVLWKTPPGVRYHTMQTHGPPLIPWVSTQPSVNTFNGNWHLLEAIAAYNHGY